MIEMQHTWIQSVCEEGTDKYVNRRTYTMILLELQTRLDCDESTL
jgi:hypothetical protein